MASKDPRLKFPDNFDGDIYNYQKFVSSVWATLNGACFDYESDINGPLEKDDKKTKNWDTLTFAILLSITLKVLLQFDSWHTEFDQSLLSYSEKVLLKDFIELKSGPEV